MTMAEDRDLSGRTVVVTGADGFVGRHACARASELGAVVRRVTRGGAGKETYAVGAIDGETEWSRILDGAHAVVHLAARVHLRKDLSPDPLAEYRKVNVGGTRRLAEAAARAGVRRLVLASSIGVYGRESPRPLDEATPTRPASSYARSKLEAEQELLLSASATSIEPVIVRAPLVYGPGDPGNLPRLIRLVATGLPLPLRLARGRRSLLYVGNFADLLTLCVSHPAAAGEVFVASDGEDVSTAELVRLIAKKMGRSVALIPVPRRFLMLGARAVGDHLDVVRLFGSLTVDSGKVRRRLGWQPPHTLEEGLAAAIRGLAPETKPSC